MKMKTNVKIVKGAANSTITDLGHALYKIAEMIMTDSKVNYVPVVSGALRRSGKVESEVITANKVTVRLGYGDAAVTYARQVHERPDYMGQGKNKYLSKPLNAAVPGMQRKIQQLIKEAAKGRTSGTP